MNTTPTALAAAVEAAVLAVAAAVIAVAEARAAMAAEPVGDFDLLAILGGEVAPTAAELAVIAATDALRAAEARQVAATAALAEATRCRRCCGTGVLDGYRHHLDGVCFACDGTGRR